MTCIVDRYLTNYNNCNLHRNNYYTRSNITFNLPRLNLSNNLDILLGLVPQKIVKCNPGISSRFFSSKNMQLEVTKYC